MPHLLRRTSASDAPLVAVVGTLALALAVPFPAAAQPAIPISATWQALPNIVPEGATVVVKTRDGNATKGRLLGLSDTAIVLEGGKVRTIPAAAVVSIEGGRGGRPVKRGTKIGFSVGIYMAVLAFAAAADQALSSEPCAPDECVSWSDAASMALVLPAMGAGIGACVGLMIPGKRTLIYSAGASNSLAGAAVGDDRRRGAVVRVTF